MGVRHVLLESALQDLSQVPGERLAAAPAAALECACRALASAAGKHADALADAPPGAVAGVSAAAAGAGVAPPAVEPETLARAIRCVEGVLQRVAALRRPALLPPPLLPAKAAEDGEASSVAAASPTPDTRCPAAACASPLFGRLAVDADGGEARIEALAGESQPPPIIRPVELTSVPDSVATVEEASAAMRKAVHCCVLLANQADVLPNTFALRASLLVHLFCSVLPAPLPLNHPERVAKCFWASAVVRYETQAELLRCLRLLLAHFSSTTLSLSATRSFDAARLLSMASLASVADAVLRLRVSDHPSVFCEHYAGAADGPVEPFGFEMGPFAVEAEYLRFHCPERTARLTQTLDYFHGMRETVSDSHLVFRWERGAHFGDGEKRLLSQVCLQMGFPMEDEELPFYLSGESRELSDNYPEMLVMRDIVFMFKALMTPTSDALPELRRWRPRDAALFWKYKPGEGYHAHAFARKLEVHPWKEGDAGDQGGAGSGWRSALGGGFLASLFGAGDARPRCPPSGGNPSNLAGKRVDTEEDVLHLTNLPTFDGLLRPSESELLLTYLTAPYLRVPLVLRHFADAQRVRALGHPEIQGVLDACFFEPGPWQPPGKVEVPACIPAPSRAHMATPAGLLLHELGNAPAPLVDAAEDILAMSLELDTGRHDAPVSAALLYSARLMTRMHAFIRFLLVESGWGKEADFPEEFQKRENVFETDEDAEASEDDDESSQNSLETGPGPGGWAGGSGARGVRCPAAAARPLLHAAHRLRVALDDRVRPTLRRWLATAVRDGAQKAACSLHAHLAYLHWSTPPAALTRRGAQTLLTAQAYILVNHAFTDATDGGASKLRAAGVLVEGESGSVASHDESLGFAPTEIFDLFQRQRASVLRWMETHPERADGVLEEVVRVLTLNSAGSDDFHLDEREERGKTRGKKSGRASRLKATVAATLAKARGASQDKEGDKEEAGVTENVTENATARDPISSIHVDRRWVRVPGPGGVGRFIPESEAAAAAKAAGVPIAKRRDARDAETERRLSPPPVGPAPSPEEEDKRTDVTSDGPSGETSETSGAEKEKSPLSYADWMRSVTTMAVEMEVNAQLGEFTVRKNRLKSLQRSVREMPDFTAALGATLAAHGAAEKRSKRANRRAGGDRGGDRVDKAVAGAATAAAALDDDSDDDDSDDDDAGEIVVHCAEVRRSKHRLWMRLVGLRHDVQLWDRDRRAPQNPFVRPYAPLFTNAQIAAGLAGAAGAVSSAVAAAGAAGLRGAERWISERLDPVVAGPAAEYLQGVELFMPLATVDGPVARLAGFAKLPEDPGGAGDKAWGFEPGARGDGETGDVTGATDPEKKKTTSGKKKPTA
jgi:hypothetical protein